MKIMCLLLILIASGVFPAWAGDEVEIITMETNKAAIDAEAIDEGSGEAQVTYAGSSQPASQPASDESYLDELEKLADLRDRGIISEEEFEAKKQQLLGL